MAVGIGHQRRSARPEQHGQAVVRDIPDQFLPARLVQVRHGLGVDAGRTEQPNPLLDNGRTLRLTRRRPAVIADMHRPQRLMGNDPRPLAMHADIAEPAQHMQSVGQQFTQVVFDIQAILQQQHPGIRRGGLHDGRREVAVTGGFCANQQPVAGWHVFGRRIGLHRIQRQRAMYRAVQLQPALSHRGKLTAQQKMHIEPGLRQHHPVEPADGTGPDYADSRLGNCSRHGNSSAVLLSACPKAVFSSVRVRRDFSAPKNSPSRTTNSAGK
ncbi:hypothetical protein D3C76_1097190 [compost metagenome]